MKTAYDIYMEVQKQEHPNRNNYTLPDDYELKAMETYASQFKTNPIEVIKKSIVELERRVDIGMWILTDELKGEIQGYKNILKLIQ